MNTQCSSRSLPQTAIEPLLLKFAVDFTVTGHMHVYERVHPVINGTVQQLPTGTPNVYTSPKAPLHVVVGTAGAMQHDSWSNPIAPWSAVRAANTFSSYGYGQVCNHGVSVTPTASRNVVPDACMQ